MEKRKSFADKLSKAGVTVSKTGAISKDPRKILASDTAQKQLAAISKIQSKIQGNNETP